MILLLLQCVLSSDEAIFGGYENVSKKYDVSYTTQVCFSSFACPRLVIPPDRHRQCLAGFIH